MRVLYLSRKNSYQERKQCPRRVAAYFQSARQCKGRQKSIVRGASCAAITAMVALQRIFLANKIFLKTALKLMDEG
jgi:hypothetical protein